MNTNARPCPRSTVCSCLVGSLGAVLLGCLGTWHGRAAQPGSPIDYARDIRPILSDNCFRCHGQDEHSRKADLRLDTAEGQRAGAVVPGQPEASEMLRRITSTDPDEIMPPPSSKRVLTPVQKELVRRWIREGASVAGHWAFRPPVRAELPAVRDTNWPRNPIDRFVLAELESRGLRPSEEADRQTLVRRLYLDLTGLPPTMEEVASFVSDSTPDAYERLVDRLLASPRLGERLAQVWLDAARYADTNGYNNDEERVMWRYRDWVLGALNSGMAYDEFVTEQLAGDLLPEPTLAQRLATGFHRNHVLTTEGGIIDEEYRVEYVADRVQTTASVLLGLTLQCARCHDHKYDPIKQREYYELFAFFNNSPDKILGYNKGAPATPYVSAPTADQQRQMQRIESHRVALQEKLAARESRLAELTAAWERQLAPDDPVRRTAASLVAHFPFDEEQGAGAANLAPAASEPGEIQGEPQWVEGKLGRALKFTGQNYVNAGQNAAFDRSDGFAFAAWVRRSSDAAITVLSKMDDPQAYRGYDLIVESGRPAVHLIHHWPDNGLKVTARQPLPKDEWTHICVTYDGSSRAAGVHIYLNGVDQELEVNNDTLTETIVTQHPLHIGRRGDSHGFEGAIDDVRFFRAVLDGEDVARLFRGEPLLDLAALLDVSPEQRSIAQRKAVEQFYFASVDPEAKQLRDELATLAKQRADLEQTIPTALVMEDLPTPRTTHILQRGQYDQPGEVVQPGVPASLPRLQDEWPRNRLGLAHWLLSNDHPLTTRVAVNRWWAMLFGLGLVETEEDFGVQGALPTHPALLDWLAVTYRTPRDAPESPGLGWDTKRLLRLMVTSSTYRQSSHISAELLAQDPNNRWLARGPRYRLSAEQVRDSALAVSGLLVEQLGGPSVKPYQPAGLWEDVSVERRFKYQPDRGAGLYRRSMYTYWKRTCPPPGMTAFDAPDREFCVIRRARTNTPLQALVLLNDPTYIEAARQVAERVMQSSGTVPTERVAVAMQQVLSRRPWPLEEQVLISIHDAALTRFRQDVDAATQLLSIGQSPRDTSLDPAEHAAWTAVASVILNMDETVTRE